MNLKDFDPDMFDEVCRHFRLGMHDAVSAGDNAGDMKMYVSESRGGGTFIVTYNWIPAPHEA